MVVQELLTEFELLVDSTEQHRERLEEYKEQKKFFSGKKKKHTFKNQFIILPQAQDIVDVIVGLPGTASDINLLREQQKKFDSAQKFKGDKAYIGEKNVTTPHKKPRKRELSEIQKQETKAFSSSRIIIEHLIRRVKVFQACCSKISSTSANLSTSQINSLRISKTPNRGVSFTYLKSLNQE